MDAILISLFNSKNRTIDAKIEGNIINIDDNNELVSVDVKYKDYKDYILKGLTFYKADLFPNPSKNDYILIDKISYNHDEFYNPIIKIHAEIIVQERSSIDKEDGFTFDFSPNNIVDTLKKSLNMEKELKSNLFTYIDSNDKYYQFKCLENNELYLIDKKYCINYENNFNTKNIIYISNYEEVYHTSKKLITLTKLSFLESMDDENLFILLENQKNISNKYLWGKIIEKDEKFKIIKFMNSQQRILKFKKYSKKVEIGQYCLFSNYIIKNDIIELNENSYSYFSKQNLYFSNKINFNKFTALQFYFLDFKENEKNIFNIIDIDGNIEENIIKNNSMEIIVDTKLLKTNYKLFPIKFRLKENIISFNSKEFFIDILQGLLNKICVLINYKSENSYSYEYLYTFFDENYDYDKIKTIKINDKEIKIDIFDNFVSKNRIRFNIVNIPFQGEFEQNFPLQDINSKNNSYLICETFKKDNNSNIYGIFNLNDIYKNLPFPINPNTIFNRYYNSFGNIYDDLKKQFTDDEALEFIAKYKNMNKGDICLSDEIIIFDEDITASQLKTRIGILISYYLNYGDETDSTKIDNFMDIQKFIKKIEKIKNKFSNNQILKMFSYLLRSTIKNHKKPELIFVSELKQNIFSPYYSAINFNLEEIDKINEYSKLFQGYLQMDSYILFNHKKKAECYSLSIEPEFIVKYHLKSNYEGFFFVERIENNILAWTEEKENIVVINETNLFERSKYREVRYIENKEDAKSHAFGISIVFRHESNSHIKKNLKNKLILSPLYYCDDGEIKEIQYKENDVLKGEDGVMIESLISEDREIIISLAKDFIYGELLDSKYFIGADFQSLLDDRKKIKERNKNYFDSLNNEKNHDLESDRTNKMKEFKKDAKSINLDAIIRKALKSGTLECGDQFYTLDLIKNMVALAEKNGNKDRLPPIFIQLDKALKESKNNGNNKINY